MPGRAPGRPKTWNRLGEEEPGRYDKACERRADCDVCGTRRLCSGAVAIPPDRQRLDARSVWWPGQKADDHDDGRAEREQKDREMQEVDRGKPLGRARQRAAVELEREPGNA